MSSAKNVRSWNPNIGIIITHRDKLEWLERLYVRHCMKSAPNSPLIYSGIGMFGMYDSCRKNIRAGWNPKWEDIAYYPEEVEFDEIIKNIDKKLGFVEYVEYVDVVLEDVEWYAEDEPLSRDLRISKQITRNTKKLKHNKKK
jgi:hypothetical protein